MYVSVLHDIKDSAAFQARGQSMVQETPAGLKALQFFPDTTGQRAVCLWEGTSIDAIRTHIDGKLGDASIQTYFEVAGDYAMGLPVGAR